LFRKNLRASSNSKRLSSAHPSLPVLDKISTISSFRYPKSQSARANVLQLLEVQKAKIEVDLRVIEAQQKALRRDDDVLVKQQNTRARRTASEHGSFTGGDGSELEVYQMKKSLLHLSVPSKQVTALQLFNNIYINGVYSQRHSTSLRYLRISQVPG
jgi:hypothetical protein